MLLFRVLLMTQRQRAMNWQEQSKSCISSWRRRVKVSCEWEMSNGTGQLYSFVTILIHWKIGIYERIFIRLLGWWKKSLCNKNFTWLVEFTWGSVCMGELSSNIPGILLWILMRRSNFARYVFILVSRFGLLFTNERTVRILVLF